MRSEGTNEARANYITMTPVIKGPLLNYRRINNHQLA